MIINITLTGSTEAIKCALTHFNRMGHPYSYRTRKSANFIKNIYITPDVEMIFFQKMFKLKEDGDKVIIPIYDNNKKITYDFTASSISYEIDNTLEANLLKIDGIDGCMTHFTTAKGFKE